MLRCRGRMLVGLRMPGLLMPRETKGLKGVSTQINQLRSRKHLWSQTENLASMRILESLGIWASVINHPCYGIFFHVIIMSCEVFPLATPTQHCSLSYSCDNLVGIKVHFSRIQFTQYLKHSSRSWYRSRIDINMSGKRLISCKVLLSSFKYLLFLLKRLKFIIEVMASDLV